MNVEAWMPFSLYTIPFEMMLCPLTDILVYSAHSHRASKNFLFFSLEDEYMGHMYFLK